VGSLEPSESSSSFHHRSSVYPDLVLLPGSLVSESSLESLELAGVRVGFFGCDHVILSFLGLFSLFDLKEFFLVILDISSDVVISFPDLALLSFLLSSDLSFLSGSEEKTLLFFSSSFGFLSLSSDSLSSLFFLL